MFACQAAPLGKVGPFRPLPMQSSAAVRFHQTGLSLQLHNPGIPNRQSADFAAIAIMVAF